MKKIYLTLDEAVIEKFEKGCRKYGLTRGRYFSHLVSARNSIGPPAIRMRKLIKALEGVDRDLKVIALKEGLSEDDRVYVMQSLSDIKKLFQKLFENFSENI
ncbi:MAG: hypothetical protein K6E75_09185 [Lachnospiraceae bacterium]|nr:hypothetical protein [Lachnospiraceae bacterium]